MSDDQNGWGVDENADTAPLRMPATAGERVQVDNEQRLLEQRLVARIEVLEARHVEREKALAEARANFYGTQWEPHKNDVKLGVDKAKSRATVGLTLGIVAIAGLFFVVALVVLLHALR